MQTIKRIALLVAGVDRLPRRTTVRDITLGQTLRLAAANRGTSC